MESLVKGAATVLISYTTHYAVTKLYSSLCVPDGFVGFVQGLVSTGSPMCAGAMEILKVTQTSYSSLIMLGATRLFVDIIMPATGQKIETTPAADT